MRTILFPQRLNMKLMKSHFQLVYMFAVRFISFCAAFANVA